MRFDLDQFHPLDHPLFACHGYPGGWRRHLSYRWEFQTGPWLRARTLCRAGWHRPGQVAKRAAVGEPWWVWDACLSCATALSERTPGPDPLA